jgi:hypothetical protein
MMPAPKGDSIFTPRGLARIVKHLGALKHPADEAFQWAIAILGNLELPARPDLYQVAGDALAPLPLDAELASYAGGLSKAVLKLGHEPGSDVHRAAELVEIFGEVQRYMDKGDARTAMRVGFRAGMLWEARRQSQDADVGRRVRLAGRPDAKGAADHEAHGRWFALDLELRATRPELNKTGRAMLIAKETGAEFEAVRKQVRKMQPKG